MLSSRLIGGASAGICFLLFLSGCSGTDVGYPRVSDSGSCPDQLGPISSAGTSAAAGSASGVSGSPGTAGANGVGGSLSSSGGSPTGSGGSPGSAGTSSAAGAPATTPFTWPSAFEPAMSPSPADGHHNAGAGCMSSTCHGSKVPFLFGGTVYKADGTTGAPNVQVGISDGTLTVTAYSASNGNIWLPSSAGQIDFASAQIAIRSAAGERAKPASAGRGAACNGGGCHSAAMRLLEP